MIDNPQVDREDLAVGEQPPQRKMRIADIVIGERIRDELGSLDKLAESIRDHGLLHAIVVDEQGRLIVGMRRLRACELLGWEEVPVRDFGEVSAEERRVMELEENLRRKPLTALEAAKTLVELKSAVTAQQV